MEKFLESNFKQKIRNLLEENMTEKGFKVWEVLDRKFPDVWSRPTSSSEKYHRKGSDGRVPNIDEHVWEMLLACVKLLRVFDIVPKTGDADMLLLATALHDAFKYGIDGMRRHTTNEHDKIVADIIIENRNMLLRALNEKQFKELEEAVRFHSGRWSTDADESFDFKNFNPKIFFIHILDMMSTHDLIKVISNHDLN